MKKHTEARLEDAIVDSLVTQGSYVLVDYAHGPAAGRYDKTRALDPILMPEPILLQRSKFSRLLLLKLPTLPLEAKSGYVRATFLPIF